MDVFSPDESVYSRRTMFIVDWDDTCVEEYRPDGTPYWPDIGPWIPGAVDSLRELSSIGRTAIYSLRCHYYEMDDHTARPRGESFKAQSAIRARLREVGLDNIDVYPNDRGKPPAMFYIDDKGLRFERDWPAILRRVKLEMEGKWPERDHSPARTPAQKASALVRGDRQKDYGHPLDNHERIAALWTVRLRDKLKPGEVIEPYEVSACMRLMKEARLMNTPGHADTLIDICGYADVEFEIHEESERRRVGMSDAV